MSLAILLTMVWHATPRSAPRRVSDYNLLPPDSIKADTGKVKLHYPLRDKKAYEKNGKLHPLDLADPPAIKNKYDLDPESYKYNYSSKIGALDYKLPASTGVLEQLKSDGKRGDNSYFRQRAQAQNFAKGNSIVPQINIGNKVVDKIFGNGVIDIRPRGTAEIIFAGNFNTVRNPAFSLRQQKTGQFDFRQKIQLNVTGQVGDKLKVNMNYDTEATFEFENQMKLDFAGKEDDIIKKIELGNVSLPLNSSLIQGSQSLFGVKTTMQFGKLTVTAVVTQQRGKTQEVELAGGSTINKFDIQSDGYDVNRHYFLAQYFRDNYEKWLHNLPFVGSPVVITRVEAWVTNRSGSFEQSRDIIGFTDLGESVKRDNKYWLVNGNPQDALLGNQVNSLYSYLNGYGNVGSAAKYRASYEIENNLSADFSTTGLKPITQYQIVNYARQLGPNEYSFNPRLGYVSLNQALNNDDILNVAFEGTISGVPFKVGEFSQDVPRNTTKPEILFLKMLKGPSLRPDLPIWDLMMKNVYSLGSFQVQPKDFKLNIVYADDPSGADLNYLPVKNEPLLSGSPLLTVFNLDNLNTQQERTPDGLFDYIEGVTINSQTGRIFLPSVEPFGKYLEKKFINDPTLANYYCYFALYDSTRFAAVQLPQFNKFFIRGTYQGSTTNEISLGSTNVPRGSVKVTANGTPLTENSDFIVDYNLGRVKIVNTALLNSGAVIKVSSESNNLFQIQQKSLIGARLDYKYSKDLIFGSTLMYLNERPLTPKVNIGEEPISNAIVGLDGTYTRQSPFLTKLVDKLPFIQTKEMSNFTVSGEYARLIPGIQKALNQKGTAYIDDFEGAETPFDLRMGNAWSLASTPQGQPELFPEGNSLGHLDYGFKRANLAWYTIATTFWRNDTYTPKHLTSNPNALSTHNTREVLQQDVFPSKQIQQGLPTTLPTLDLSFFPSEKGPYNYNINDVNPDGTLKNPANNWGGIMRKIDQNDFEQANIDYIEVWVMDPFADKPNSVDKGYLYLNLGNISEDILRDNRRSAENGLPKSNDIDPLSLTDSTVWGRVPKAPVINYAFDANPDSRQRQDIGLDGLNDDDEKTFFSSSYLQQLKARLSDSAYAAVSADPSNDDYHYYLGKEYDGKQLGLLDRYRKFNRHQGNSKTVDQSLKDEAYPTASTNFPDNEDLNKDYTVNSVEDYFQYKIEIARNAFTIGRNYVTDTHTVSAKFVNGTYASEIWYQLKIPVREFERKVGEINDFKSIRFMRMYMRGFAEPTVLRFASLQLVRADWRKYLNNLEAGGEHKPIDPTDNTQFVVSTVNIEKNSARKPIIYKVPPGIQREIDFSSPNSIQQNEQSISLLTCNLKDGDARAVFKNSTLDLRQYGTLRMFLHAEGKNVKSNELTAFIRFGTDLTNNYYEYEIPLSITPEGAFDPSVIWPQINEMTISLEEMINTKIARTNSNWAFTSPYNRKVGNGTYTVVGLPDFSQCKVFMLGVRNPKRIPGSNTDDGFSKCSEVWFNELRMTDFNTRGGDAANGRVVAKLADFGSVSVSGSYKGVGWGGIDKKLLERNLSDNYQYDLQTNFELGKFFPVNSGLSIPFFFSYGNTLIRPFYNPLNPDTKLQKEINETTNPERSSQISRASDDYTARKSFNFTNVRKNRVGSKAAYPWDIENFTFTYSFNENFRRNQTVDYNLLRNYKGMVTYNYTFVNKPFEPFKKLSNKNLELIKEFSLNYLPASWGVRVEADRRYGELLNRNNDSKETILPVLFDKMFTMRRNYEMRWDLTKNIKVNYNATLDARIDEPRGKIDASTPEKNDSIKHNFWNGGRTTKYDQTARIDYNIPINKLPYMAWVSQLSYNYTVNYQWLQAPPAADSLGNTIQNSQQQQWNTNLNFASLYNKFEILRKINNPGQPAPAKPKSKTPIAEGDKKGIKKAKEETSRDNYPLWVTLPIKLLTSIKNMSGTYSKIQGTLLPGFNPRPQYIGQNFNNNAPGFDFIFGLQDPNYRFKAAKNGWVSSDPRIVNPYVQNYQEAITARALVEPLEDFRIELNVSKNYSKSTTAYFRYDPDSNGGTYRDFGKPIEQGSYSISYSIIRTAFSKENNDGVTEVFQQFEKNRIDIARRLALQRGIAIPSDTFPEGFGPYQQDVLIPAFLAAYQGKSASTVALSPFQNFPIPNWKVTYNGLSKIKAIKEFASNINIQHAYQSTYNVAGFQTVIDTVRNTTLSKDYTPGYVIRQISITERFGPLIGIDVTLNNNVTASVKYNKDRTLNFALGNRQLNEQKGEEFVFGIGYRTTKLVIPFPIAGRRRQLTNDINFRFDFTIRENQTKIRNLDRPSNDPVLGQTVYSIKPQIDYMINEKLMLRIFYDRRQTNPFTSNSFPTVITSGGFSIRYTIQ
ncbi:MAG: cell surface protein SprA [Bacteroidia bacterium]|nr:cell surface protein SprA [Bacteroidia bacterium]